MNHIKGSQKQTEVGAGMYEEMQGRRYDVVGYWSIWLVIISQNMNQRSTSAIRKMKTDLGDQHAFQRKIARAIKDKKQYISKMTTPRSYHPNRNPNSINPTIHKQDKVVDATNNSKEKVAVIRIQRDFVENIQQKGRFGNFSCINHPKKKGAFEDVQHRDSFYCHQCAINLVRSNVQVMSVSSESLIIKMFLQEQLQRIHQEEQKAKFILEEHYNSLREAFSNFYRESHFSITKHEIIEFGNFEISESLSKLTETLGQITICQLKFDDHEKQNRAQNVQAKQIDKYYYKSSKERIDQKDQSNRSLDPIPQKNSSFVNRSRDSSFYKKGSRPDIQNGSKYDIKKGFYLR